MYNCTILAGTQAMYCSFLRLGTQSMYNSALLAAGDFFIHKNKSIV